MPDFAAIDLQAMKDYLIKDLKIEEGIVKNISAELKESHQIVFSFLIWDHYFEGVQSNRKVFIAELRSDSVQSIPLSLLGYKKPVALLLRGILENLLRHIYYYDHPIEFTLLETGHHVTVKDLLIYAKLHPKFAGNKRLIHALTEIDQLYSEISKQVHAQSLDHMQLTKALEELKFDNNFFNWYYKQLKYISALANLLLAVFHSEYDTFDADFKRLIIRRIKKGDRCIVWQSGTT